MVISVGCVAAGYDILGKLEVFEVWTKNVDEKEVSETNNCYRWAKLLRNMLFHENFYFLFLDFFSITFYMFFLIVQIEINLFLVRCCVQILLSF